ncbi:MAG: DUF1987 domain-containing protein [Bacteroidales bacterium]|jgi:hypothetical protein|nr:DUF1987 domain-containing protein [Bacteroidales bacterium]
MEPLYIEGTDESPEIILDKSAGNFEFKGKSLPEDVKAFYNPVLEWLDGYIANPNPDTVVNFRMDYFNSASAKQIMDILTCFEKVYQKGNDVLIRWHFASDDEDMEDAGASYEGIVDLPIELIAY